MNNTTIKLNADTTFTTKLIEEGSQAPITLSHHQHLFHLGPTNVTCLPMPGEESKTTIPESQLCGLTEIEDNALLYLEGRIEYGEVYDTFHVERVTEFTTQAEAASAPTQMPNALRLSLTRRLNAQLPRP